MNPLFSDGRRRLVKGAVAAGLVPALPLPLAAAQPSGQWQKVIASTGEAMPPVGMGTWITFNVGDDAAARDERAKVLAAFFAAGGGMIDSSPMYGSAESVLGDLLERIPDEKQTGFFSATKVWTNGDGQSQIDQSHQLWRLPKFDFRRKHFVPRV